MVTPVMPVSAGVGECELSLSEKTAPRSWPGRYGNPALGALHHQRLPGAVATKLFRKHPPRLLAVTSERPYVLTVLGGNAFDSSMRIAVTDEGSTPVGETTQTAPAAGHAPTPSGKGAPFDIAVRIAVDLSGCRQRVVRSRSGHWSGDLTGREVTGKAIAAIDEIADPRERAHNAQR